MRGRIGKVGVFVLALVFAIGAMGAAFASWTDTVVIEGNVTTGDLGYEICGFSETWVYKNLDDGALVVGDLPLDPTSGNYMYVASANWTDQAPGMLPEGQCIQDANQSFEVVFDNLFPCPQFCADIVLHYTGSVPARLSVGMDYGENWLEDLFMRTPPEATMEAFRGSMGDDGEIDWEDTPVDLEGLQLEYCDYVMIVWCIHIPQENDLMNETASFTTTIDMVQWNEYEAPTT